jgi:hypothetical protein
MAIARNDANKCLPFVQVDDCSGGLLPVGIGSQELPLDFPEQEARRSARERVE